MSLLNAIFGKVEAAKQAEQQQLAADYQGLVAFIVAETLSPTIDEPKTKAGKADLESAVDIHADYLASCMAAGIATEQQIRELAADAERLKEYLTTGELKEIDTTSLEEKFQALAEECREKLRVAQLAIHDGRGQNSERTTARQNAQRLIRERPELGVMADSMKLSWRPVRPNQPAPEQAEAV